MRVAASALGIALLIATALPVLAQDRYGDAVVEKGELTVVRGGQNLKFNKPNESVPVVVGDVLRVGADSRVVLKTREKSTISMGANAVFQVKPFQYQEKQGFARMLFGRFRSVVAGLTAGETVNAKTATAVIGVKGTENLASIRPRGDTMVIGVDDTTDVRGSAGRRSVAAIPGGRPGAYMPPVAVPAADRGGEADFILIPSAPASDFQARRVQTGGGNEVPVDPNEITLVIGDNPPTDPVPVPEEVLDAFSGDNLDSPESNTDDAGEFPGQKGLIDAGITSEDELNEGESGDVEEPPAGPEVEGEGEAGGEPNVEAPDLSEGQQNLYRGNVTIEFGSVQP
jgi:hypothetical protein